MANDIWKAHLQRVVSASSQARTLEMVPEWIERNTFMNGKPFSFSGHRYQLDILRDQSPNLIVTKPSQVGCSEMVARMIVAKATILRPYNVIYCMPSAKASQDFCKGRVSTLIDESPYLQEIVDKNNDSTTMKKLGYSLIHFKGAYKDAQAISTPADAVCADEYAFCDETIVKQFYSRLTHSKHKHMVLFSTPTLPGVTIDKEFGLSSRKYRMCKCTHCNEWFWPEFLRHCRIPGHDVDWLSITRKELEGLPWRDTKIFCPNCGKEPDLSHEHREWVTENKDSTSLSSGYSVSPFDVPSIIKPAYLAERSVSYARKTDFLNVNLGVAAEDKESTILRSELDAILVPPGFSGSSSIVMGLDLGMICHAIIAAVLPDGGVTILKAERIPVSNLTDRYFELKSQWRVRLTVADFYPYSESILRLQNRDPNLWAAVYSNTKSTEPFTVKRIEDDPFKGQQEVRRVNINRNVAFDMLMYGVRSRNMLKVTDSDDEDWIRHMLSMKRVKVFKEDELVYEWQKTDGEDHWAHGGVYALIASKLLPMSSGNVSGLPLLSTFKYKPQQ